MTWMEENSDAASTAQLAIAIKEIPVAVVRIGIMIEMIVTITVMITIEVIGNRI